MSLVRFYPSSLPSVSILIALCISLLSLALTSHSAHSILSALSPTLSFLSLDELIPPSFTLLSSSSLLLTHSLAHPFLPLFSLSFSHLSLDLPSISLTVLSCSSFNFIHHILPFASYSLSALSLTHHFHSFVFFSRSRLSLLLIILPRSSPALSLIPGSHTSLFLTHSFLSLIRPTFLPYFHLCFSSLSLAYLTLSLPLSCTSLLLVPLSFSSLSSPPPLSSS